MPASSGNYLVLVKRRCSLCKPKLEIGTGLTGREGGTTHAVGTGTFSFHSLFLSVTSNDRCPGAFRDESCSEEVSGTVAAEVIVKH